MSVRPLAWHDLISLYRFRNQILCLDSSVELTRGSPLGWIAHLADFNPARNVYSAIVQSKDGAAPLLGRIEHNIGDRSVHLTCLAPEENACSPGLPDLIEELARQAGSWGAYYLTAEIEEKHPVFEELRRSGFGVITWLRVWQMKPNAVNRAQEQKSWQPANPVDEIAVRNLYNSLVPPLVQTVEPFAGFRTMALVYRQEGEILAYVEGIAGPKGMLLTPLIHPSVEDIDTLLSDLLLRLPVRPNVPLYLSVRSYQAWIEMALENLKAEVSPRRAILVKHFVVPQRSLAQNSIQAVIEKYKAEPTAPFARNFSKGKNHTSQ